MVKIEKAKKGFLVSSDCYRIGIDNSGTIRKMIYNGINTGVKRDGCEYWINKGVHFEQEFGSILKHSQKQNRLSVTATVKVPYKKRGGGTCTTKYLFNDDSIVIESEIHPKHKMITYDKYVCFTPGAYTHYKVGGEFKKIDQRRAIYGDEKSITLKDNTKSIIINCLSKTSEMRIYKTSSMIEIKPNWIDPVMKIEYRFEEKENKPDETNKTKE